jgi:hypothetical protein
MSGIAAATPCADSPAGPLSLYEFLYLISGRAQVKPEPRAETEKLRQAQASLP